MIIFYILIGFAIGGIANYIFDRVSDQVNTIGDFHYHIDEQGKTIYWVEFYDEESAKKIPMCSEIKFRVNKHK